ncbi:hypothetical protein HanRHA438_Chr13g0586581 [Helianthus annuus]|nr:hypothetical protein HanRHA438_Chr13g0586581 [Helianthus annuus]
MFGEGERRCRLATRNVIRDRVRVATRNRGCESRPADSRTLMIATRKQNTMSRDVGCDSEP